MPRRSPAVKLTAPTASKTPATIEARTKMTPQMSQSIAPAPTLRSGRGKVAV